MMSAASRKQIEIDERIADAIERFNTDLDQVTAHGPADRKPRPADPVSGGRTRTRTLDKLIKSQLLYQLSYAP